MPRTILPLALICAAFGAGAGLSSLALDLRPDPPPAWTPPEPPAVCDDPSNADERDACMAGLYRNLLTAESACPWALRPEGRTY